MIYTAIEHNTFGSNCLLHIVNFALQQSVGFFICQK